MKLHCLFLLAALLVVGTSSYAQLVPPITAECATSIDGTVVGTQNPLNAPIVAPVFSGTLPAGTYFLQIVWYDALGHLTLASPEVAVQLSGTGELQVSPPASGMPATAAGMNVYIGTTTGSETFQGTVAGSATYTQSVPLVSGATLPGVNTTLCKVIANDAGWPTGTGYDISLTTPAGATMPGYPMQWQLLGPGTTINISQGLPLYNGTVTYPIPILARPYNHGPQSISGPLSMTNYNIVDVGRLGVGTSLPAWGVDAEGSGLQGAINANTGYLFNGFAPLNHVLLGNGSYYVDSSFIPASIISGLFYQTLELNGVAETQRPAFNFSQRFLATDSASPARTNVDLNAPGSANLVATYGSTPGASTALAAFDGSGNIIPAGGSGVNSPHRVILGSPVSLSVDTQTIILTESVTFPSGGGTYRADVRYGMWATIGSNLCVAAVIDTTNSHTYASSGQNANGTGYIGMAASEISSSTYAGGATATFTLQVECNTTGTITVNSGAYPSFTPAEPTYLSVTPVFSN